MYTSGNDSVAIELVGSGLTISGAYESARTYAVGGTITGSGALTLADNTGSLLLSGDVGGTWIAIDSQIVPYYSIDMLTDANGQDYVIHGRVPCLLNGDRAELLIVFDSRQKNGYISGARYTYGSGQTETVAKSETELQSGDRIDFVCDYYSYDGTYQDSYLFGEPMTYRGDHVVSDRTLDRSKTSPMYIFTDIYGNEFYSPVIPG